MNYETISNLANYRRGSTLGKKINLGSFECPDFENREVSDFEEDNQESSMLQIGQKSQVETD